jgi:3-oxoacyl-[acyl-carrier-protein] synthase-3
MSKVGRAGVVGVGAALPDTVITNTDLANILDTSDVWIQSRTGIVERRIGESNAQLAAAAALKAMSHANVGRRDIGLLVLATTSPDRHVPATSASVQDILGLSCGAFDLNAACSGFVYAVAVAASMAGTLGPIVVVGSEILTRITSSTDRSTAVLMGDGAGAVVLVASDDDEDEVWADLGVDGSLESLLYAELGGHMKMNGSEVFRNAVRMGTESARRVLDEAGISMAEVGLFVPHQANSRIVDAIAHRLGADRQCVRAIEKTGNTSAASIPLALSKAMEEGRLDHPKRLLLSGFGAGMTWASALVRWRPPEAPK